MTKAQAMYIYLHIHISKDVESLEECNHKSLVWETGCSTQAMVPAREEMLKQENCFTDDIQNF